MGMVLFVLILFEVVGSSHNIAAVLVLLVFQGAMIWVTSKGLCDLVASVWWNSKLLWKL